MLNPRPLSSADGFETELDREIQAGFANLNYDQRAKWDLHNPEWVNDAIPLMHNGKNILDFVTVDEDILALVTQMEVEEQKLVLQPSQYNDEELFARLDALKRMTHFARPKGTKVDELRAKMLECRAIAGRDLSRTSKPRVCAISKQKAARVPGEDDFKGVGTGAGLVQAKKLFGKGSQGGRGGRSDGKEENGYEKMPRHLSGKMGNQTKDWR